MLGTNIRFPGGSSYCGCCSVIVSRDTVSVSDMTLILYLVIASNFSCGLCDPSGDVGVVVKVAVLTVTASVLGIVSSRLNF